MRIAAAVAAAFLAAASPARARSLRPPALRDVGVTQHVGDKVPLDLKFRGPGGTSVTLGDYFRPGRPVLLILAYSKCPMLCSLILRAARDALRGLDPDRLAPGTDYQILTVSIDPDETPEQAAKTSRGLVRDLAAGGWDGEWPMLVGDASSIDLLASRLGYRFTRDPRSGQFAHPAVMFVLTGKGKIARYLLGTRFDADQVASSILAAKAGKPQSSVGSSVLSCFRFTGALSRHGATIQTFFRIGAATMFAALLITIVLLFRLERRQRR